MLLLLWEGYSCETFWHYICKFKKRKKNILVPHCIRQGISELVLLVEINLLLTIFVYGGLSPSSFCQLLQNSAYAIVGYAAF